jgi:hypothetical protein
VQRDSNDIGRLLDKHGSDQRLETCSRTKKTPGTRRINDDTVSISCILPVVGSGKR